MLKEASAKLDSEGQGISVGGFGCRDVSGEGCRGFYKGLETA